MARRRDGAGTQARSGTATAEWSPRQESNLYLPLRRRPFYPLNYGERLEDTGRACDLTRSQASDCSSPSEAGRAQRTGRVSAAEAGAAAPAGGTAPPAIGSTVRPGVPHFQVQIRSSAFSAPVWARKVKRWASL